MENASKALIIAAEVLLGVILLTLMVFMFRAMGAFSDAVDKNIETKNVNEFNAPLEKYRGRTDITAPDIITMGNYAKQYNEKMGTTKLTVNAKIGSKTISVHQLDDSNEEQYEFINNYSTDTTNGESKIVYYKCTQMTYDEETGRINKITLEKVK